MIEQERQRRKEIWEMLIVKGGPRNVTPQLIRQLGIYGGAQGVWVDKARTADLTHDDFGGSWSPDGSEIAYASREGNGIPSIWIMGSDGSNRYQLTTDYGTEEEDWDYWPRWSPDGMRILFSSRRAGKGVFDQWVINNDGTGLQQLTDTNRDDEWGCWSPDGKHILYCSGINDNYNLWMVDSDGSNEKQITFYSDSTYCPCWVD